MFKVLGAVMIYAKVGDTAMVYTGDYNMTPDRHLGAAQIDRLQLDLLITEYHKTLSILKLQTLLHVWNIWTWNLSEILSGWIFLVLENWHNSGGAH